MGALIPIFGILLLGTIVASFWGGIKLAQRFISNPAGAVLLGIALGVVFCITGGIALVGGCAALSGPMNFH